ncbi:MAG: MFS transporter, partial [Leeuwenhoekiella sp.]
AFPFGNAFALRRSKLGRQGAYMGLYSMSFSLAHVFGHNSGMQLISFFGFDKTWIVMLIITAIAFALLYYVHKKVKNGEEYSLKKIPLTK